LIACANDGFEVAATEEGDGVACAKDFQEAANAVLEICSCTVIEGQTEVTSSAYQSNTIAATTSTKVFLGQTETTDGKEQK